MGQMWTSFLELYERMFNIFNVLKKKKIVGGSFSILRNFTCAANEPNVLKRPTLEVYGRVRVC